MSAKDFKDLFFSSDEYSFLFDNKNLGSNIALLALGGSHAYGTNIEGSDIDLRGFAVESKRQIITGKGFEQVIDKNTDTVVCSMKKLFSLLTKCNPNIIEMLGCRDEDYVLVNEIGQKVLDNKKLFLSKSAFYTFSGYASAQMKRLNTCTIAPVLNSHRNDHILNAVQSCLLNVINEKDEDYSEFVEAIDLILPPNDSDESNILSEAFIKIDAGEYNVKDLYDIIGSVNNTLANFAKGSRHNTEAIKYNKMAKHMMHLLRLYMMVIDILKDGEIITYRENEHDLLMSIRNKEYLESDGSIKPEFFNIVKDYEKKTEDALKKSKLPERANTKAIDQLLVDIYEEFVF